MKKFTWQTLLYIVIVGIGLFTLSWIDFYSTTIYFSEKLNQFVAIHEQTWYPVINVLICLVTSYFLGKIFSFSKNTWPLVFDFYLLLLCVCVPNLIASNSAVYLSLSFTRSAKFFELIMLIKNYIKGIAFVILLAAIFFRKKNRHSATTITLLFIVAIVCAILYEFETFAYAWYFYFGLLGIVPIIYLAMRQNELKIPREK